MTNAIGLDISTWQDSPAIPGHINFDKARLAGASFVFIKASQGVWSDPDFEMNWSAAKAAGLLRGAYHYMDWSKPPLQQAQYFAGLLALDPGELPPVCDYECRTGAPSSGAARLVLRAFLEETKRLTGKTPMIYTSPGYWCEYGSADGYWAQYPLWIAHYGVAVPLIPRPWTCCTFWQSTAKGNGYLYGVESRDVDLDEFSGDEAALRAFAGLSDQPDLPTTRWDVAITAWARQLGYAGPDPGDDNEGDG